MSRSTEKSKPGVMKLGRRPRASSRKSPDIRWSPVKVYFIEPEWDDAIQVRWDAWEAQDARHCTT